MITAKVYQAIVNYAKAHYESSKELYTKRNANLENIYDHILRGKIAEFCAYYQLQDLGYILDKPDLAIYLDEEKSHDADLLIRGKDNIYYFEPKRLHIKSVKKSNFDKYGVSFLLEATDPIINNPTSLDYFGVLIEQSELNYRLFKVISSLEVEFAYPIRRDLHTKRAVYL